LYEFIAGKFHPAGDAVLGGDRAQGGDVFGL
jgi:hypothetical protein